MDINAKIKLIAETMSGYTVLVDSSNGANVQLSKIQMPCILIFIQDAGEVLSANSHYRDSVNIRVAFLNKIPKGFKESDVETMRYELKQDMFILFHKLKFDFQFKTNTESLRYEIVYDEFDDNLIGVVFNDNIKERVGLNLACDVPDSHGELPSSPSFCQKVSECSSIVSINELIEGLQEQIDNLPTVGSVQSVTGPNVDNTDPLNPIINNLGLIKIVDLNGDFFTDLATASAYIRTHIDENIFPITDESFNSGVYYFTVPQNTECILASNFLGDDSNTITAYIIDRLGLIIKYTTKCFQKNSGNNYLGNCEFDITSGASSDAPFYYATGQNSIGSFILNSTVWFGKDSTGKFTFRGNIGVSETTMYGLPNTTMHVQASKYTSNLGKKHASLVNSGKVFFDGIDKVEKNIIVSISITATLDTNYTNTANATYTDPTPIADRGYTVLVISGTATIGGVAYNVAGTKIERIYHGGAWITYIYSNGGLIVDYSSASTYNGWSSFTTQKIFGVDHALYTIWTVEVSGTSNSALAIVTIPVAHNAAYPNILNTVLVTNNGINSSTGRVRLDAGGNTISWATSAGAGGFSASGTKTVRCQITIYK